MGASRAKCFCEWYIAQLSGAHRRALPVVANRTQEPRAGRQLRHNVGIARSDSLRTVATAEVDASCLHRTPFASRGVGLRGDAEEYCDSSAHAFANMANRSDEGSNEGPKRDLPSVDARECASSERTNPGSANSLIDALQEITSRTCWHFASSYRRPECLRVYSETVGQWCAQAPLWPWHGRASGAKDVAVERTRWDKIHRAGPWPPQQYPHRRAKRTCFNMVSCSDATMQSGNA